MKYFLSFFISLLLCQLIFSQTSYQKTIFSSQEKLRATSIEKIGDGGYIFLANGEAPHPIDYSDGHYFITKIDSAGNILWSQSFVFSIFSFSGDYDIKKLNDSSFLVLSNGIMLKFKNNGQRESKVSFTDSTFSFFRNVCVTNDHGLILLARTSPNLVAIIKTDSLNHVLWSRDYNIGFRPNPLKVFNTIDGNYIITGTYQDSLGGLSKLFLITLDSLGQVLNSNEYHKSGTIGVSNVAFDSIHSMLYFTDVDTATSKFILGKINTNDGQLNWVNYYNTDATKMILQNDTIYLYAYNATKHFITEFDSSGAPVGSIVWAETPPAVDFVFNNNTFTLLSSEFSHINYTQFNATSGPFCSQPSTSISINPTNFITSPINVVSNIRHFTENIDSISVVYDNYVSYNSCTSQNIQGLETTNDLFEIYPQPAHDIVNLKYLGSKEGDFTLLIFDTFGKLIKSASADFISANQISISTEEFARGNYILSIREKSNIIFRAPIIIE